VKLLPLEASGETHIKARLHKVSFDVGVLPYFDKKRVPLRKS